MNEKLSAEKLNAPVLVRWQGAGRERFLIQLYWAHWKHHLRDTARGNQPWKKNTWYPFRSNRSVVDKASAQDPDCQWVVKTIGTNRDMYDLQSYATQELNGMVLVMLICVKWTARSRCADHSNKLWTTVGWWSGSYVQISSMDKYQTCTDRTDRADRYDAKHRCNCANDPYKPCKWHPRAVNDLIRPPWKTYQDNR